MDKELLLDLLKTPRALVALCGAPTQRSHTASLGSSNGIVVDNVRFSKMLGNMILKYETWTINGSESADMQSAYTKDGAYIGLWQDTRDLYDKGIDPECLPGSSVCSIGFCEDEQKWYGWSHRAMYGFGITDDYHFSDTCVPNPEEHEKRRITTLDEAKESAINFAADVS